MDSLKQKTEHLIVGLKATDNPSVRSVWLSSYISDTLKQKQITIYEAFLLKIEDLSLQRKAYIQPAWNNSVIIRTLLEILNIRLLSFLIQGNISTDFMLDQALEAYKLNKELRPHYIVDEYIHFLKGTSDKAYLEKLLAMRNNTKKPFEKGPYHDEVFPYDSCKYETLLLENNTITVHEINMDVEALLVELCLLD